MEQPLKKSVSEASLDLSASLARLGLLSTTSVMVSANPVPTNQ